MGDLVIARTGNQVVEQVAFTTTAQGVFERPTMLLDGDIDGQEVTTKGMGNMFDLLTTIRSLSGTAKLRWRVRHADAEQSMRQPS